MPDIQYTAIVKSLQSYLNAKMPLSPLLAVDGDLGTKTVRRAQAYQLKVRTRVEAEQAPKPIKPTPKTSEWRLAKSLETFRAQINAAYPNRSKASDGTIGDVSHQSRSSDHNPHVRDGDQPVVTAFDLTHDVANGVNCGVIAELIKHDIRVEYVIWNKRIYNRGVSLKWRAYSGSNPHTTHMHISVHESKALYDNVRPWEIISDE